MMYNDIDYSLIDPGQLYQTDHHECDFWIEHGGKQLRPWLTVVQDMRSRAIVGWNLGPVPHQDAILSAYLMAFRSWALPERLRIDNGSDYASRLLAGVTKATRDRLHRQHGSDWRRVLQRDANLVECVDPRFAGIVEELGIATVYAIPYAPWSKGTTERWFRTFEDRCGKTFTTYCGNTALAKPECLETIRRGYTRDQKRRLRKRYGRAWKKVAILRFVDTSDVPTLDQARTAIGEYIEEYHHTPHSADDMGGRTPLEVWRIATRLRRADDQALLFLMQARGVFRVGANGVAFTVGGVRLKYGAGNACLYKYRGREVFITIDPHQLDRCHAFTADRKRYIGALDANKRISPMATVDDLREANAAVGRRRKIIHQVVRESPARTRGAAEEMAARRREHVAELRATGTEDASPTIVAVETGLETAVRDANAAKAKAPRRDRKARDLAQAAEALSYGHGPHTAEPAEPRATLGLLVSPAGNETDSTVTDDGDGEQGRDVEQPRPDVLSLVAGCRHERRPQQD